VDNIIDDLLIALDATEVGWQNTLKYRLIGWFIICEGGEDRPLADHKEGCH